MADINPQDLEVYTESYLKKMTVPDLKTILQSFGAAAGRMNKAQLIATILELKENMIRVEEYAPPSTFAATLATARMASAAQRKAGGTRRPPPNPEFVIIRIKNKFNNALEIGDYNAAVEVLKKYNGGDKSQLIARALYSDYLGGSSMIEVVSLLNDFINFVDDGLGLDKLEMYFRPFLTEVLKISTQNEMNVLMDELTVLVDDGLSAEMVIQMAARANNLVLVESLSERWNVDPVPILVEEVRYLYTIADRQQLDR